MQPIIASVALFIAICGIAIAQKQPAGTSAPALDPRTGIVHSQRLETGVPLGGIGTGGFQLMTDGAISRAAFNNNWHQPTGDLPGCFAAIRARIADRAEARVLALKSGYGLPTVKRLDFDGLYPQATLTYPDSALPVAVTLRAFSPLVPFDLANSSFPAAAFVFQIKNTAKVPVEVTCALSWENLLGVGGTAARGPFQDRAGNRVAAVPDREGFFALRFTGGFPLPALAGADGDARRLSESEGTPDIRANASGEYTLMARPERREAVVTEAGWNALDARPAWWDGFVRAGDVSGAAPVGEEGKAHPAGVLAVRLTIRPGDTVFFPFAFAWHTPVHRPFADADYGHAYARTFPDSARAARDLLDDWRSLQSLTNEWQNRLLFSSLPRWMARRLINAASVLTTHTIHAADGRFALLDEIGAGASSALASLEHHLSAATLLLAFFPELYAQEMLQCARAQSASGAVPRSLGDLEGVFGVPDAIGDATAGALPGDAAAMRPARAASALPLDPVSASAFAWRVARYALATGDHAFVQALLPNVRLALRAVMERGLDADGLPMPPDSEAQTRPKTVTLWMAGLRAGEEIARLAGETGLAEDCRRALSRAAAGMRKRFWNGEFYAEPGRAGTGATPRPEDVSAADQLMGQWASDALETGNLLPEAELDRALQSLLSRHANAKSGEFGTPFLARANGSPPPDARPPMPGSRDCLLPAALLGIASLTIAHDPGDAGVNLWQRLDATRSNVLRSPWLSPLRFDAATGQPPAPRAASVTHAADWNALTALLGFAYREDAGHLSLAVRLPGTWRSLTAPVFAPTFRGTVSYRPTARGGVLQFRLDRLLVLEAATPKGLPGSRPGLELKTLRLPGPPPRVGAPAPAPPTVQVSLSRVPVGSRVTVEPSGALLLTFETPLKLAAGDRLEIEAH